MSGERALVTAFDENYLWPGIVAAATALRNSPEDTRLYVLGVELGPPAVATIEEAISDDRLAVLDAASLAQGMPSWRHISNAAWARVGIASLLPRTVRRVVYVDADTMTRGDLTPLFEMSLDGKVLAASIERPMPTHWDRHLYGKSVTPSWDYASETSAPWTYCYFNSGVMSVDLEAWRAADVETRVFEVAADLPTSFSLLDQDALNSVLFDDWHLIDWKTWNWPAYLKHEDAWRARVAHFIASPKPWVASPLGAPFNLEYLRAARGLGWKLSPGRVRVVSGLIETVTPNALVMRRKRIARAVRRRGGN